MRPLAFQIGSSAARRLTVKNSNGTLQENGFYETHMATRIIFEKMPVLSTFLTVSNVRELDNFFLSQMHSRVAVGGGPDKKELLACLEYWKCRSP